MNKVIKFFLLLLISTQVSAVFINSQGSGEVLLIPYYSVNNGLNVNASVTNTSEDVKAIKITIREGLNGYAMLSYNVYLGPNDTWSFVMGPYPSSVDGYVGQDFAAHASYDHSCAAGLSGWPQEFDPTVLVDGSDNISRAREGFIEILEMGVLEGYLAEAAMVGIDGEPNNCELLQEAWEPGGVWDTNPNRYMEPATGGLTAEADIMRVEDGINYSIPVVALADFFAEGAHSHVAPEDSQLSLDAAAPKATVLTDEKPYQLSFERGIDAVSAVLMADELSSTYALDTPVNGLSVTVYSQPTRRFYTDYATQTAEPPYSSEMNVMMCPPDHYGGTEMNQAVFDRESDYDSVQGTVGGMIQIKDSLCGSVSVQKMVFPDTLPSADDITGSDNLQFQESVTGGTENGFVLSRFLNTRPLVATDINSGKTVHILGLPVIGFSLGRFTNFNAQPNILAQYGFSHGIKSKVTVVAL
ncbi:MAG: hypothetical protein ACK5L8_12720 [Marinicella pacifica]|jgi:hypothetical protein